MFLGANALRLPFEVIVVARQAERNGLMVYAFGYLKQIMRAPKPVDGKEPHDRMCP